MGYRIIKIDLEFPVYTPQNIGVGNITQVCFVRYAYKSQAIPKSKLTQDLLQISFDGLNQFFPFLPNDKIAKTPGKTPFVSMQYRVLRGIPAWAFLLVADDYCTYGLGPHEETAFISKNIMTGDQFVMKRNAVKVAVAFGATVLINRFVSTETGTLFIHAWNIYQAPDDALSVPYEVEMVWAGNPIQCFGAQVKNLSGLGEVYAQPLEFVNNGVIAKNFDINVHNLDPANAGNFCGSLCLSFMPAYANHDWPGEVDGNRN